jgi:hypothetical protein
LKREGERRVREAIGKYTEKPDAREMIDPPRSREQQVDWDRCPLQSEEGRLIYMIATSKIKGRIN